MEIIKSKCMGLCAGVKRAIGLVNNLYKSNQLFNCNGNPAVYCLGELIHNESVMAELKNQGLKVVDDVNKIPNNSTVIIRAHGAKNEEFDVLKDKNCNIIDATCPKVLRSQKLVSDYSTRDYTILFCGDGDHAETQSVKSFVKKDHCNNFIPIPNISVLNELYFNNLVNKNPLQELPVANNDSNNDSTQLREKAFLTTSCNLKKWQQPCPVTAKVGNSCTQSPLALDIHEYVLLAQTTFDKAEFQKISSIIKSYIPNLIIEDTVCDATKKRQDALLELCKIADCALVIGSKSSSNTMRLLQIAKSHCNCAYLIENTCEVDAFIKSLSSLQLKNNNTKDHGDIKIGVTAGASTPDNLIDLAIDKLKTVQ